MAGFGGAGDMMKQMAQRFMQRKGRVPPGIARKAGPQGPEGMSLPPGKMPGKSDRPEGKVGPKMGLRGGGLPEGTEKPGNGFGRGLGEMLAGLRAGGQSGPLGPAVQQFMQGAKGSMPPPSTANAQPGNPAAPAVRSLVPGAQAPGFGPSGMAQAMGGAMRKTMPGRMGQVMSPATGAGRAPLPQGPVSEDLVHQLLQKLKGGGSGSRY